MKRNRSKRDSTKGNEFLARVYCWRVDLNYGYKIKTACKVYLPQQYQQFQHTNECGELMFYKIFWFQEWQANNSSSSIFFICTMYSDPTKLIRAFCWKYYFKFLEPKKLLFIKQCLSVDIYSQPVKIFWQSLNKIFSQFNYFHDTLFWITVK